MEIVTEILLCAGRHSICSWVVQIFSLKQLCMLMFLHWGFIIFIHNFFSLGLIILFLDIFLLFWTSILMIQTKELD